MSIGFNFGDLIINTIRYDSKNELSNRVRELGKGFVVESDHFHCAEYLLLEASTPDAKNKTYCGIICSGTGIPPQIAHHPQKYLFWLAIDDTLSLVDFHEPKCITTIKLPWVFWTLILLDNGHLVVVHELGAICFDPDAVKVWDLSGRDKLNDFYIKDNNLFCILDNGETISHTLIME